MATIAKANPTTTPAINAGVSLGTISQQVSALFSLQCAWAAFVASAELASVPPPKPKHPKHNQRNIQFPDMWSNQSIVSNSPQLHFSSNDVRQSESAGKLSQIESTDCCTFDLNEMDCGSWSQYLASLNIVDIESLNDKHADLQSFRGFIFLRWLGMGFPSVSESQPVALPASAVNIAPHRKLMGYLSRKTKLAMRPLISIWAHRTDPSTNVNAGMA